MITRVFLQYFRCYFNFITGRNNPSAVAFRHLIHEKTHRIPRGSHKSIRTAAGLLYRRLYTDIFRKGFQVEDKGGDTCFYNDSVQDWAIDYVKTNAGELNMAMYLSPSNITLNISTFNKLIYLILLFILQVLAFPLLFIRPIGIWALHFTILHEHIKILSVIKKKRITKFFDFFSYEIGSSFLNLLLEKRNIKNHFITSPTPLYETYPDCVSDVFISTSPYHSEELVHSKLNNKYPLRFYCNKMIQWPYNEFNELLELNTGNNYNNKKKLGIYTSGVWWRNKEKHQEFADGFFESEFLLLNHLKRFASEMPEFELCLFLHPKERQTPEQLAEGLDFYRQQLGDVPFGLMDFTKPTKSQFSLCDISISVCSNTTYERLFGGFKSIFTPYCLPNFPIDGNALEYICAKNYQELKEKILAFDQLTDEAFFELSGLKKYHHKYAEFQSIEIVHEIKQPF